jgi:hypothetical protein
LNQPPLLILLYQLTQQLQRIQLHLLILLGQRVLLLQLCL